MSPNFILTATCPKGLEELLTDEIFSFGAELVKRHVAGITVSATLEVAYRCCLWSRLANRVLMPLTSFSINSAESLYEGIAAVEWSEHFTSEQTFVVDFNGTNRAITNTQFGAQKTKDAVVDHFVARGGRRPSIDLRNPDWRLNVHLQRDEATVSIDLAGESLHRRGYREHGGIAPLKENLAAALLMRADWPGVAARGGALIDPLCGSGTLLIEGALMAMDIAPGILRERWSFESWLQHDAAVWKHLYDDALQRKHNAMQRQWPEIRGYDASSAALRAAEENIEQADLTGKVRVMRKELAHFVRPTHQILDTGLVITNPPYGERLGEQESLKHLYAHLGERLREEFKGWSAAVFTGNPDLGKTMGLRSNKQYRLFNGAIPAQLLLFDIDAQYFVDRDKPLLSERLPAPELSSGAQMFANRLQKNRKRLQKWIQQSGVSCYRLYDADMPEYAVAVDYYGDKVHVAEYAAPSSIDEAAAQQRLDEVLSAIPVVLNISTDRIVLKQRARQRGKTQYQKLAQRQEFFEVREGEARLLINLNDYLDTGLFLDHRPVRRKIFEIAKGKRFLNLFCYTATASLHAALGGAKTTTSVDMSQTYLDWARRNLAVNGLSEARNHLEQADCRRWLADCKQDFDLILLDPPTFSNSKRMDDTLDIQRDHVDLIHQAVRVLAPGGLLIFSNNRKRFQLDPVLSEIFDVKDMSRWSLDPDFERVPDIHQCWFISHK
ncbi:MAG: rRNA ((2445)-N(2))/((2069)-N(7))-methyltransferase [Verrucomicrobiaceae bacterium]|nr:rRNA ((2445)-N(2))/((2069)-N(7))-methyltransferase [Verrucomicrobiaceae bacterium]